jgi:hypothetical protein
MTRNEAFATLSSDLEKTIFVLWGQWQGADSDTSRPPRGQGRRTLNSQ